MLCRFSLTCLFVLGACARPGRAPPFDAGPMVVSFDAGTRADDDGGMVVRFVALGDTGKANADQHRAGATVAKLCAAHGCDFVVLLGDNFYPSGVSSTDDPQWQTAFVEPYRAVDAPFYAVLGNHDYGGNGTGNEIDKAQHEVDYSKVNPKWRLPAPHYRFSVRDVDFFVADTNRSMFGLDKQVRADFERWLQDSKATWRIAFGHHPLKSNGRHGNAGSYDGVALVPIANGAGVQRFVEDQVCGLADAYFAGHDHDLEWLQPTCTRPGSSLHTELLISGAGSAVTPFPTKMTNADHWRGEVIGFVYVILRERTFTGTYFDGDGNVLFTRSFTK
jgi:tartrate-resistant acid phosphatase type 5